MSSKIFSCAGGEVCLPPVPMTDRADGGNLMVLPPRVVWDRTELSVDELIRWSLLVAATAQSMLNVLPQLRDGCINYWDAGNWALNHDAEPKGLKSPRQHRKMHLHLLGRSPSCKDPDWQWGESPIFPRFDKSDNGSVKREQLNEAECLAIITNIKSLLSGKYIIGSSDLL